MTRPIRPEDRSLPEIVQLVTARDCEIYALGIGLGDDPLNPDDLSWFLDRARGAFPTFASTLCHPRTALKEALPDIDMTGAVHAEQDLVLFRPLPREGRYAAKAKIVKAVDKGPGKAGVFRVERRLHLNGEPDPIAILTHTLFAPRGGGFGGVTTSAHALPPCPEREPDRIVRIPTAPSLALMHRQSGDLNPLHVDPDFAATLGFHQPILHGLATFGLAARALLLGGGTSLTRLAGRFSKPVFPGETVEVLIWTGPHNQTHFDVRVAEREAIVLTCGLAEFAH